MKYIDIHELANKVQDGKGTPYEMELLDDWYLQWKPEDIQIDSLQFESIMERIWYNLPVQGKVRSKSFLIWSWIAAAIILLALSSSLIFVGDYIQVKNRRELIAANDVLRSNREILLLLGNGKKINVSNAKKGEIARQSGITVTKDGNGSLIYHVSGNPSNINESNTIVVPKGIISKVLLSDGTKVWLNAGSSLKFPATFASLPKRIVKLTGEAYFEVTHNKDQRFEVHTKNQIVEDLGTKFNIHAYEDEGHVKTTLLEGAVKVNNVALKPGEQSVFNGNKISVQKTDANGAILWKNGFILFKNQDFKSIMHQIERWYDVKILYEGRVPARSFNGKLMPGESISRVFEWLDFNKVKYSVKGKTVTILE